MIRSPALLQYLKMPIARIHAARLAVLLKLRNGLSRGRRHDLDICHHVHDSIAGVICTCGLLLTHRLSLLMCRLSCTVLASREWRQTYDGNA
jgi:hypothetical protein